MSRQCVSYSLLCPKSVCSCACLVGHISVLTLWFIAGRISRAVASINQHILTSEDVVSCCLDLGAPSISFRINGQPVQGMFENFNIDGLFFPVVSFSAGVKYVFVLDTHLCH